MSASVAVFNGMRAHQHQHQHQMPGAGLQATAPPTPVAIPRPQVGIERLPARRLSNEPRESMNCKSCRKRKIKCNRLRPACEACQVFQCPCIYDAVPKKRGPKTDVLEALLKRVDGLEAKLKEKGTDDDSPPLSATKSSPGSGSVLARPELAPISTESSGPPAKRLAIEPQASPQNAQGVETAVLSPVTSASLPVINEQSPGTIQPEALLGTYFTRFHAKPFHILDESSVRQRLQLNQLPEYLLHGIYAIAARYTAHPRGFQYAVKLSEDYAARSRQGIDMDDPSIDSLQALLLLVLAFAAAGKGKKAYMLMTNAIGMAMALELHREVDTQAPVTPIEKEMRRRLFWTCYLIDRYIACGSKRPSLIMDANILVRLPCWLANPSSLPVEGEFFQCGSNLHYFQGRGKRPQGSNGMLIDITRLLGITNRYLASGGVKGDSHFPWHPLSNLSKIREDLDVWASGTEEVFSSIDTLFGQSDSSVLVLSKLIYHLIHCLIYRPFLPIDLAELAGNGQHQSWQIEATNMCFLHANAISELIELGKQTNSVEWPAFVGYCICTAGTVHIHGAHYSRQGAGGEVDVFSSANDFLSREMQQLSELRYAWASVQHQRETLQGIYNAHTELIKTIRKNNAAYTPGFQLEDFFDRYSNIGGPGGTTFQFDAAALSLSDVVVDFTADSYTGHDLYAPRGAQGLERPSLKRKNTTPTVWKPGTSDIMGSAHAGSIAGGDRRLSLQQQSMIMPTSAALMTGTPLLDQRMDIRQMSLGTHLDTSIPNMGDKHQITQFGHIDAASGMPTLAGQPFTPPYTYDTSHNPTNPTNQVPNDPSTSYDPMFGTLPTNAFTSPAPWQGDDSQTKLDHDNVAPDQGAAAAAAAAQRVVEGSNDSPGTAQGDEKDPFLNLLEQLAENEHRFNGLGNDLDFFLAGTNSGG